MTTFISYFSTHRETTAISSFGLLAVLSTCICEIYCTAITNALCIVHLWGLRINFGGGRKWNKSTFLAHVPGVQRKCPGP